MESFEQVGGMWWLPESPNKKVRGWLTFDPEKGIYLEIYDSIKETDRMFLFEEHSYKIILGMASHIGDVTLYECSGISNTIFVKCVLVGEHCSSEDQLLFRNVAINYSYAEDWIGLSGLRQLIETDVESDTVRRIQYEYTPPPTINIQLPSFNVAIFFRLNSNSRGFHQTTLTESMYIAVEPPQDMRLDWYLRETFIHLQNLLTLGIGKPVHPYYIQGSLKNSNRRVSILIKTGHRLGERPGYSRISDEMIFTYREVKDQLELYLNNWFSKSEKLGAVHELYFGTLYEFSAYKKIEFLLMAQAVEAYHRIMHDGSYMTKENFEPIYEILVNNIPSELATEHRQSLENRLKYGYEYSLRRRLNEIIRDVLKDLDEIVIPLIGKQKDFVDKIVNTRNDMTHYDENSKEKPIEELYGYTELLRHILRLCLLLEMGMTADLIKSLYERNRLFQVWLYEATKNSD